MENYHGGKKGGSKGHLTGMNWRQVQRSLASGQAIRCLAERGVATDR